RGAPRRLRQAVRLARPEQDRRLRGPLLGRRRGRQDRLAPRLREGRLEMMYAWSFSARTADEVARLARALGRHRYLRAADHRLHFSIDLALAHLPSFAPRAAAFEARASREAGLDLCSRDPSLWRPATIDEISTVLEAFWTPDAEGM